jgi:hypothetical protein
VPLEWDEPHDVYCSLDMPGKGNCRECRELLRTALTRNV